MFANKQTLICYEFTDLEPFKIRKKSQTFQKIASYDKIFKNIFEIFFRMVTDGPLKY